MMNFSAVNGKPIRIMYSNRDPSIRKSGNANIFVKVRDHLHCPKKLLIICTNLHCIVCALTLHCSISSLLIICQGFR